MRVIRLLGASAQLAAALLALSQAVAAEAPLRTAAAVQALSAEDARQHREVQLTGVITFLWNTRTTEFTVQDETGAVWCPPILLPTGCTFGTRVEIEGRTELGGLGPIVQAEVVRPLGAGTLPPARPASYEELLTAQLHCQRVEITGIVRGQRVNPEFGLGWLALELAVGGGRVTVNVTHEITGHPELVDAEVRVRGVNLHSLDPHQQSFVPMIYAHSLADVEVLRPAEPRPFHQAVVPLSRVMRNVGVAGAGHRVRVQGTVTAVRPGGSFFLQDATRGLQVFLRERPYPEPGEVVDVAGFPEPGAFSPVLRDADWRPTGSRHSPDPLPASPSEAFKHDARLIAVTGRLTAIGNAENEIILTLAGHGQAFRAHVPNADRRAWRVGSELQITGVCSVEIGDWESLVTRRQPQGFVLFANGPAAVRQVRAAPFWTLTRVISGLVLLGVALSLALGIIWLRGRRQLREVTHAREAARAQFEAVLTERARMAREIHDTLTQGFAGISAQLEVLADRLEGLPAELRRHLDLARELARTNLEEARRTVWNLRSHTLEEHGLAGALERLGRQLTQGTPLAFDFELAGAVRLLPPDVENNLLRIGQEAITNAVRHSGGRHVKVKLAYAPDGVGLSVCDDGRGCDLNRVSPSRAGGFGLSGLRERAEAMHARWELRSTPGQGTHIEIHVPHV
jgi:signal transduction histidine kinase